MTLVPRSPDGRKDSVSAWVGTAAGTTPVSSADVDASFTAATPKLQASTTTADIRNTWLLPSKHWRPYQTHLAMPKQARCCARESPRLMLCDTAARLRVIWLRCKASAASVISESSLGTSLGTRLPPSGWDLKIQCLQRSSGPACTLTVNPAMQQRNCKSCAARRQFWQQYPSRKPCPG